MRPKHLAIPAIILTLTALLYTGCNRKPLKYLLLPPVAAAYDGNTIISDNSPVLLGNLKITVNTNARTVAMNTGYSLPGNRAYATTVMIPDPILLDKIQDIRISSSTDYNSAFPAYKDMSASCIFFYHNDTITKEALLERLNFVQSFSGDGMYRVAPFDIIIATQPSAPSERDFIVEYITDKNSRLADTTQKIMLVP